MWGKEGTYDPVKRNTDFWNYLCINGSKHHSEGGDGRRHWSHHICYTSGRQFNRWPTCLRSRFDSATFQDYLFLAFSGMGQLSSNILTLNDSRPSKRFERFVLPAELYPRPSRKPGSWKGCSHYWCASMLPLRPKFNQNFSKSWPKREPAALKPYGLRVSHNLFTISFTEIKT